MGQTLTHGIYLPEEGERNCYDGLAGNWQLLDGAVGTIAEHTTQIAGKAPLVHTHTKSDITDLLNSNFIPSANNSYDLGSASYQWKSVYAQSYYYNGVAWGLDKANEWTGDNSFTSSSITLKNPYITRGTIPNANRNYVLNFTDSNNDNVGMIFQQVRTGSGSYKMTFSLNNGTTDHRFNFFGFTNGTSSLIPEVSGVTELGSSDNKWKTFNGVNPGALSIFNLSATQDPIDIPNTWVTDGSAWNALNVSNVGDGWIYLNYRPCGANDYILVRFGGTNASIYPSMIFPATMLHDSTYYLYVLIPVAKAMGNIYLEIKLDSNAVLVTHSFIPAYGTV